MVWLIFQRWTVLATMGSITLLFLLCMMSTQEDRMPFGWSNWVLSLTSTSTTTTTSRPSSNGSNSIRTNNGGAKSSSSSSSSLVLMDQNSSNAKVTGKRNNVQSSFLNFAIIGYPKTATSFVLEWLSQHPDIAAYPYELHYLQHGLLTEMFNAMCNLTLDTCDDDEPASKVIQRGYKAPRDIVSPIAMSLLQQHFHNTKLIIGIRHPVWLFESFYNFRIRKHYTMANPTSLLFWNECPTNLTHNVCLKELQFHHHLSQLGKTNLSTLEELELLSDTFTTTKILQPSFRMPNPVFLYEFSQLSDRNETRADVFRHDMSQFLEVDPLLPKIAPGGGYPSNRAKALRICDDKHTKLRHELQHVAQQASRWIVTYFLSSPDVTVSSPDHFRRLLQDWELDPCP